MLKNATIFIFISTISDIILKQHHKIPIKRNMALVHLHVYLGVRNFPVGSQISTVVEPIRKQ